MGKVVKIVAGIAIAAAAIALAAPTGGLSIAGALSLTGIAASVVGAIGAAVFATVATLALNALIPPPGTKREPENYAQTLADSQIIIGKCRAMSLKMAFFHPVGKTHRYFVWVVAGHRVKGLTRWYLNDEVVTVNGAGMVTSGKYAGHAWLWFERGDYDAVANSTFVAECGGKWTTNHRGRNVAKVYAKFEMTDDVVQAGRPIITCEVEGSDEIYDPRTDSTGYSNNAILAFYWWMALPREDGGFGCYPEEIDWDWVATEANVCDEQVPLKAGGSEPRYTLDGYMQTGADPSSVRGILVDNMAGRFTYSGGLMLARPGYWVPVSTTISEDDLADAVAYDLLTPGDQRVTEISASWNDPDKLYVADELPPRSIPSPDIAQGSLDLPFVKSRTRGQRIQKIRLLQGGAAITLSLPLNINGLGLAPMDTVMLGGNRYPRLANTAFTVSNWSISPGFGVPVSVREENEDMYAWTVADEIDRGVVQTIDQAELIGDTPQALPLDAPTEFKGAQTAALTVKLDWRNPKSSLFDHIVIVRDGAALPASIVGGLGATLSATDNPPATGAHTYRIRAFSTDGGTTVDSPQITVNVS
ncbi:hypothetical protein [Sphingomonas faeni]|uniref:hypothetical protein n=1 Tax=Sphingomonas faeni TaxID=185950 RepID=UPI003351003D